MIGPVVLFAAATGIPSGLALAEAGSAQTAVRLLDETVSAGVVAEIRNRSQNVTRTAFLFAGGFDPVAIPASAGDTLHLTVKDAGGSVLLSGMGLVPLTRRPIVVRTNPPPRKRDVPLNATMIIVFNLVADIAYGVLDPRVRLA